MRSADAAVAEPVLAHLHGLELELGSLTHHSGVSTAGMIGKDSVAIFVVAEVEDRIHQIQLR